MRKLLVILAAAWTAACAARSQPEAVSAARVREAELGLAPTRNFERFDANREFLRCYWTGVLELPDGYDGLRKRKGPCRADPKRFDLFEYRPEAMAHRRTPVTAALEAAAPQRRDFVVAHEDFHDRPGASDASPAWEEAAGVLVGILTAAPTPGDAAEQADRFLRKAERINQAHAELQALYRAHDSGNVPRTEALRRKQHTFDRLRRACEGAPAAPSFGPCPALFNNAALAFETTYTRRFPEVHRIYVENGRDARRTIDALQVRLSCEPSCTP